MNNGKKKVTKLINIGILDIRNAGDKDLGEVNMINVGHILHTPETIDLLKRGGKRINVGQFVDANPEARVLLSPTTFTDEYFSQQGSALELLAFAPIMVDWETTRGHRQRTGTLGCLWRTLDLPPAPVGHAAVQDPTSERRYGGL